ncbi:MAG: DUF1540 domain-containing protein [Oscillospiraceae bacterium]|nr:DUF1540 domain-containing protein [Oscillospiraceae bacterium]
MDQKTANPSIECSVSSCAYHCNDKQYCSLDTIKVGCQERNVGSCDCTECASFRLGDHGTCCK